MTRPVPVELGEWRPDQMPHMSPALSEAVNVLRVAGAYCPMSAHAPVAGTQLAGRANGFLSAPAPDGTPVIYASTGNKIYRVLTGGLVQAYDAGAISVADWWFAQLKGKIIAGNKYNAPVGGLAGSAFMPLGGDPPAAAVGAVVAPGFLVLGNLTSDSIDGYQPRRVRWSGFQNPDTWGTSVGTEADFEDMTDEGGPVVAIAGRTTAAVFQRKAVTRMQFGGAQVFSFTVVERNRGAVSAGAVCDAGAMTFYRSDDGFFAFDGLQSQPIGTDRVDKWFSDNVNPARLDRISSAYDPVNRCVMWAFPENGQDENSAIIAFSIAENSWTLIRLGMQQLGTSATLPVRLEDMPTPDTALLSWDDPIYAGKKPVLAGIDANRTYGTFTGGTLAATITTGDFISAPGQRSFVTGVRPVIDNNSATVAVGQRAQTDGDTVSFASASVQGVDGVCPQRIDARLLRYRLATAANSNWSRASALEIEMRRTGRR